jgi:glycosyltransferase involved in cell wall biosynthesis
VRVAEISTLSRPVPPEGEGSVEALVSHITEGLVRRGHEVTLFAVAGSRTSASLRSPVKTSYTDNPRKWDFQLYEAYQVCEAFRAWRDFDVIHCHSYLHGLLFCDWVPIPSLHALHIRFGPDLRFLATRTSNRHLQFSSQWQARHCRDLPGVHVIPHGVEMAQFRVAPPKERGEHLAFLGRFIPEKGALQAIQLAKASSLPLKLAGPRNDLFAEKIAPLLDGRQFEYVGELQGRAKADFLATARALIYPIQRPEPFGLVLIEAMACGLPILALSRGAVPEIVVHGQTGWIAKSKTDLLEGLRVVDALDRQTIRRHAEERFSSEVMIDRIERLLLDIVAESRR